MSQKPRPVLVLGAGLVGRVIALDLAADEGRQVTVLDRDQAALSRLEGVQTYCGDCADTGLIASLAADHGLVVGALPSTLGLAALEAVIRAGVPMCDISFMAEDARVHHPLAMEQGVTAVVDCGVAPGMSNLLAALAAQRLDPCRSITIRVGGLPVDRSGPWG
ncbi:MAG: saccharopine dehydrogenase NADP-binding domain-containing protein, partial [Phycisphaerales bacterium]|nr:saccharopine dehydrogenase NADP-binding domain-containing protein [Phycisphaerales bacterium]